MFLLHPVQRDEAGRRHRKQIPVKLLCVLISYQKLCYRESKITLDKCFFLYVKTKLF
jgi:hypothetical protein